MSMMHHVYLLERYGMRLTIEELASELETTPAALHTRISNGALDLPTYLDGKRRYADSRDVADYIDRMRVTARREGARA